MNSSLALSPLVAPLALMVAAFFARRDDSARPQVALRITRAATPLGARCRCAGGWLHLYALTAACAASHRYMGDLEWQSLDPAPQLEH